MKIIQQAYEILTDLSDPIKTILKPIERAGRTCYRSENNTTDDSCITFCKNILNRGHEAVIEHSQLSVKFVCDRAIANELVRHRLASYCQESTRYVNYSKDKFGNEIKVICPKEFESDNINYNIWYNSCLQAEQAYMALLSNGIKPEFARNVLPLSTATEIIMTANIREWRNVFKLRSSHNMCAHPQMRALCDALLKELKYKIPVLFDDIN